MQQASIKTKKLFKNQNKATAEATSMSPPFWIEKHSSVNDRRQNLTDEYIIYIKELHIQKIFFFFFFSEIGFGSLMDVKVPARIIIQIQ